MTSTTATNLPPLEATPSPYHSYWGDHEQTSTENIQRRQSEGGTNDENSPNEELKYSCAICLNILDKPCGCGSCQARFCRPCMERVAKEGGASSKCCYCGRPFTLESIQVDEVLQEEMKNCVAPVMCPIRGCGKKIPINAFRLHEAQCDYIRMKCKFSEWGCEWIGCKKDLEHHDNNECEFRNGMGRLVNAIREKTHNQNQTIARMQDTTVNQVVNRHTRQLQMLKGRNAGNIFDVLAMSYEAVCFPGRLAATKELWGDMMLQNNVDARSLAFNVLLVFPFMLCMTKLPFLIPYYLSYGISASRLYKLGFSGLWEVVENGIEGSSIIQAQLFVLLAFASMVLDGEVGGNASQWSHPVFRDWTAFFIFLANTMFVDVMNLWPGIAILLFTFSFTVSFSSCVAAVLEKVNGSEEGTLKKCKMYSAIVLAYRYSFLFLLCGYSSDRVLMVFTVIFLRVFIYAIVDTHDLDHDFFSLERTLFCIQVAVGAFLAGEIYIPFKKDKTTALRDWLIGFPLLVFFSAYANGMYFCGQGVGRTIYKEGESHRNHNNERIRTHYVLPSQRPSMTGIATIFLALLYVVFIICVPFEYDD